MIIDLNRKDMITIYEALIFTSKYANTYSTEHLPCTNSRYLSCAKVLYPKLEKLLKFEED